jgi:hypothetical protein
MKVRTLFNYFTLSLAVACSGGTASEEETEAADAQEETASADETKEITPSLELVWESDTLLITNESVLYYPEGEQLFVSNINGQPLDQDENGYLSIMKPDGSIEVQEWITELDAPKGMAEANGMLYVTNIDELVEIDIAAGVIKARYPVEGAVFLNDVAMGDNQVYFSDMNTGKLHMLSDGEVSTVAEGLEGLNGLAYQAEEGNLYMLNNVGLQRMNSEGEIATVNDEVTGGDGLIILEEDVFLASRWQGEIWLIRDGNATILLDSKEKMQTADIGYIPEENLVLVPRFFSNKVSAYRLSY